MVGLTALSSRSGRAVATFVNFYVSRGSTAGFLRGGEKYYICFADNSLPLPTVKNFENSLILYEVIVKSLTPRFF